MRTKKEIFYTYEDRPKTKEELYKEDFLEVLIDIRDELVKSNKK